MECTHTHRRVFMVENRRNDIKSIIKSIMKKKVNPKLKQYEGNETVNSLVQTVKIPRNEILSLATPDLEITLF